MNYAGARVSPNFYQPPPLPFWSSLCSMPLYSARYTGGKDPFMEVKDPGCRVDLPKSDFCNQWDLKAIHSSVFEMQKIHQNLNL